MIHFLVAFGLLLHVALWGLGAARLAMPRAWGPWWPVLILPCGYALQSAVVWFGAHAGLRGTQSYAWWSEVLPVALLAAGIWRRSRTRRTSAAKSANPQRASAGPFGATLREIWIDISRFGVVWALVAGCLVLLVLPVAIASRGLTTISLGSCDAADYAAGARVLLEFAHGDRDGFLGLTEVVRIASVDNFFDYWLRLNHFTPSALMALNGTILGCAPHELATLFTAALLASTLPVVFWSARAIIGYSGGVSVLIAALFGVSPIMWYVVAQVSPGQLLAAQAVVLLTWAGVALWRMRLTWRRGASFALVLAIAYWLLLGSYNFFLIVCLVPAIAWVGGLALWRRAGRRFACWLVLMLWPLAACAVVFRGRVAGMAERFSLLQTYDFGWQIPALTAEGWLGMVSGPELKAWDFFGLRWLLSACVVGLLGWAVLRAVQQRRRAVWTMLAMIVPVLGGYIFLQARGARLGTNASYDAYKLFAVFYPLLLPAFCWWVTLRRSRKLHEWFFVASVASVVLAFNLAGTGMFMWKMIRPPLVVDNELRQLRKIEAMADVRSVNLLIPDMWSRLWANAFLLRKPHYFQTHTYEGRLNTPLRGDWDLEGGIVSVGLPPNGRRQVTPRFALVDTHHPLFVRAYIDERLDRNWHGAEHAPGATEQWRWTSGDATLQLENPHDYPLAIDALLDGWSPLRREVRFTRLTGEDRPAASVAEHRGKTRFPVLGIPPGTSTLLLRTRPAAAPVGDDPRPLGVCVFRLTLVPHD